MSDAPSPIPEAAIRAAILDLALQRGRGKSFCPSEVARALSSDWRPLMADVRQVAEAMAEVKATRRGAELPATAPGGPIRLSLR